MSKNDQIQQIQERLAEEIRLKRKQIGLSQEALALMAGVDRTMYPNLSEALQIPRC